MTVERIIKEALEKPESERAKIAEILISSLHELLPRDIEEAWQKECNPVGLKKLILVKSNVYPGRK
ncbi:MAG: hypothetical protein GY941_18290 [Planctomycetes bacterium]|nr:hypothetical protein [Planctomycetota bacterium]